MSERIVTVGSAQGLHARTAKIFAEAAAGRPVRVTVACGAKGPVPAASLLGLLTLGAVHGAEVTLRADGEGADAVLDELSALLARDLDAEDAGAGDAGTAGDAGRG
ncbi:HPr family phosphocarrier protein [Actinomadura xylanilytica]|uniref:HPr family phosphocarrier protein n=1 Tax=Actinomadura xylanilytica TaxID=887459 RepID=UPI00255A993C|nr:HPr family phosphocarrier protein [Actinomadura xylanilytica]MDL4771862.1 HPr family phosphocarrier protein [Actinomadura xylanilytica]